MQVKSKKIALEIIKKTAFPLLIFLSAVTGYIFYKIKIVPRISSELNANLYKHIYAILTISIGFIIHKTADAILTWYEENFAQKTASRLDDELMPLLKKIVKTCVWVIILLIILTVYGVNINALIAALGVGSLAIALAAQDTIANIIAGFLIMVDRPFRIGDRIKLPSGENVEVLDIGVRRSRFLSEEKAIIIAPNLDLSKSKITNYTYGDQRNK